MADIQNMIDTVRGRIREYLTEAFPDFVEFDNGSFTLQAGSATISVTIREWYEDDIAVQFSSHLAQVEAMTPELMEWLLRTNAQLHFGAFGLLFDGTIVYTHSLPGGDLTRAEFVGTARTVGVIADHYDDEVKRMTGGVMAG